VLSTTQTEGLLIDPQKMNDAVAENNKAVSEAKDS
jgi:hypothetical protein